MQRTSLVLLASLLSTAGCASHRQAAKSLAALGVVSLVGGAYVTSSSCPDHDCSIGPSLTDPVVQSAGYAVAATGAIELVTALVILAAADDTWLDKERK